MAKKTEKEFKVFDLAKAAKTAVKLMNDANKEGAAIMIVEASITDGFCNYSYQIMRGIGQGLIHNVKGKIGIVHDDMRNAFARLNVHLAVIDDVYKHSDIQFQDIDKMHGEDLTLLYEVAGFKIKGGEENESVVIIGNKKLSIGARGEIESPKIPLDNLSSYTWYNELKDALNECRTEVELFHYGKYTPIIKDEEETDKSQGNLFKGEKNEEEEEPLEEFDNAKV